MGQELLWALRTLQDLAERASLNLKSFRASTSTPSTRVQELDITGHTEVTIMELAHLDSEPGGAAHIHPIPDSGLSRIPKAKRLHASHIRSHTRYWTAQQLWKLHLMISRNESPPRDGCGTPDIVHCSFSSPLTKVIAARKAPME